MEKEKGSSAPTGSIPKAKPSQKGQENIFVSLILEIEEVQEIDPQNMQKDLQMQETLATLKIGKYLGGTLKDKDSVTEGEDQDSEESEKGGEIGDSQTSVRRFTRGRKSSREKREQETYKEKLQGTQPNLENKLAKNPKAHIN